MDISANRDRFVADAGSGAGPVPAGVVAEFQACGVVVLRRAFREWVEPLRAGVAAVMADPSPFERTVRPDDGSPPFFQDYCNWDRIEEFRRFVFESPVSYTHLTLPTKRIV